MQWKTELPCCKCIVLIYLYNQWGECYNKKDFQTFVYYFALLWSNTKSVFTKFTSINLQKVKENKLPSLEKENRILRKEFNTIWCCKVEVGVAGMGHKLWFSKENLEKVQ